MRWSDLSPELRILAALDHAGVRPEVGDQNAKRRWSEKFADGCAVAFADELRRSPQFATRHIRPVDLASGTEPLTPLG